MTSPIRSLLPFVISSFIVVMIVTTFGLSGLRVPLMLGHLVLMFFLFGRVAKTDSISLVFFGLFLFFIFQFLLAPIGIMYFLQGLLMTLMYLVFYWYAVSNTQILFQEDIDKFSLAILFCIFPLFISFGTMGLSRSTGLFNNPNLTPHTGLSLLPIVLLSSNKKVRIFAIFCVLLLIFRSGSRSSLLAFSLFLGFIWIYGNLFKGKVPFWIVLLIIFGTAWLSWNILEMAVYFLNALKLIASEDSHLLYLGISGRDKIWEILLERWQMNPWFGWGMGDGKVELKEGHELGAHNSYVDLLVRIGIIGSSLLAIIIFILLRKVNNSKNIREKTMAFGHFIIILSLSTNSSTLFVFNYYLFFCFITFAFSQSKIISLKEYLNSKSLVH